MKETEAKPTTIKVYHRTRDQLKILAALRGQTMMEVINQLVEEAMRPDEKEAPVEGASNS